MDEELEQGAETQGGAEQPQQTEQVVESKEPLSLRETLEQAFEKGDEPKDDAPKGNEPKEQVQPDDKAKPQVTSEVVPNELDVAPKSWRAGPKAKWAALDPEVRREIQRREADTAKVFGESGQLRNFANQFNEAIRPYEARIRSLNVHPVEAMQKLLHSDYILSSSAAPVAARFMAKLINDYGIDIRELDRALAGEPEQDPVQSKVDQLLSQRLAPLNQFLQLQQQQQQRIDQQRGQAAVSEVEAMAQDTAKYPHFEAVRETMADLVDFYASKGVFEPLDKMYARAVAMNPELSALTSQQQVRQQAASATNQARRALAASASVTGLPSGAPVAAKSNGSLRDAVEAAFAAHSGR